jgi:hypothetical protein
MTTSTGVFGNPEIKRAARSCRLMRFLVTALPNEVGRAKPTLGGIFVAIARAERTLDRTRTPCALSAANDERPIKRPAATATYALSLARPLARRALSTRRPPAVAMRARKPCFLARRRLFGWNVRFTGKPPKDIPGELRRAEQNPSRLGEKAPLRNHCVSLMIFQCISCSREVLRKGQKAARPERLERDADGDGRFRPS